jgi:hypothetical protein
MKCLPACGFTQYPDNITVLSNHAESCSVAAPAGEKKIVWRNQEFFVVSEVEDGDRDMEVTLKEFEPAPEVKAVDVRQMASMAMSKADIADPDTSNSPIEVLDEVVIEVEPEEA